MRAFSIAAVVLMSFPACENAAQKSVDKALEHAQHLGRTVETDVSEVRQGLPKGAEQLQKLYRGETPPRDDLSAVREALERAHSKVQDLRVAKSTFFALVAPDGTILRNDQEQDLMAGKSAFSSFPGLKQALSGKYIETHGSMAEAAGVKGADGQWVAAAPISVDGRVQGLYVTGWSWSSYAYRLEFALRSKLKSELAPNEKLPLVYVYLLVDRGVFGAPVSPEVNARTIAALEPLKKVQGSAPFSAQLSITGRDFGLAVQPTAALGSQAAVAVLRSET
jgi:hypothetical protein